MCCTSLKLFTFLDKSILLFKFFNVIFSWEVSAELAHWLFLLNYAHPTNGDFPGGSDSKTGK